ncbi:RNA pyrophosphohydrolase [Faunimonas sp. B44]|uniref:RNA pyrophosphohydrolase n=1 Tax=Faunimonas sp. B44 TaxID=3461493 RepID=UPI004044A25E
MTVDPLHPSYRRCVGLAVFNPAGRVFIGRRKGSVETDGSRFQWQMPQGGIDPGESPYEAAVRELFEETGIRSVALLREAPDWLCYDLPGAAAASVWGGRYRGQTQKWFAFRFEGDEDEIDVAAPGGHKAEFSDWRWEPLARVPALVIPFKRPVYERVAVEFAPFAAGAPAGA